MYKHLIVVTGSKWCGLMPKKSKAKALKSEDRCCKKWHHCETSIAGKVFNCKNIAAKRP